MYLLVNRIPADPNEIAVYEANPERLVVIRPVVDASSQAVGVAGFVVYPSRVRDAAIPAALDAAVQRQPAGTLDGVRLSIVDEDGGAVYAPNGAAASASVASVPLEFPYPRWRLEAAPAGVTPEEEAAGQFRWGALQIALAAALLVVGAAMAVRASSREMRALRLKADFVSNMTHELQSPLTSIKLHAELLRTERLGTPAEIAECGTFIEREADRLSRLVNNVLDFGRIDAGRKTYRFREVSLVAIVEGVVEELYPRVERANLYVDFEAERDVPLAIADPAAVGQAVANVLDNAVKWSKPGDRIEIRCGARAGWAWVSIGDSGPGIASEEHARIFERFYRIETGLQHDVQGSGIGLALVKHVVDAHRGRVRVASEPGRGSTFTIELPAAGARPEGVAYGRMGEVSGDEAPDRRG
jgi:signal transduction histidine kinase